MEFELYSHQNHKRTHDQISQSSSQTPPTWVASQPEPSTNLHQANSSPFHFTVPALRYEGDGLDFRRPTMSTNRQEVIDLTGDGSGQPGRSFSGTLGPRSVSRLPVTPPHQLIQDVISIDDHDDAARVHVNASSPDLEFMFSRTLLPTTMPHSRPHGTGPPGAGGPGSPPMRSAPSHSQMASSRPSWAEWRNHGQRRRRFDAAVTTEEFYRERHRQQENLPRVPHGDIHAQIMEELFIRDPMFMNANPEMDLPDQLNFIAQGFAMGTGAQAAVNARPRPPPPTYDPPSPPRAGYTRDPKEEDILLCPNCEEELGVGKDDIKKQVWVIKKCGHVRFTLSLFSTYFKAKQGLGLLRGVYKASAEIRKIKGIATRVTKAVFQVCG